MLKREKPDVIITPNAPTLQKLLESAGWKIPRDVGLAWLSCQRLGDSLSGIWQNGDGIGALAVDTLISMLERHEHGLPQQATTFMLEGQWNEGRTLRPPPPA